MYRYSLPLRPLLLVASMTLLGSHQTLAQQSSEALTTEQLDQLFSMSIEQLLEVPVDVGSRGQNRQWKDSPVSMDIISKQELQKSGYGDLNQILSHTLPYFNFQQLTLRDGSDHSRPFALRGMSPDQVLVLLNGKRFHPGALTHLSTALGKGTNTVDLSFFPVSAISRIEILKDGAAAQYGSDAIAGIINIVLDKDIPDQIQLSTGSTYQGDGDYYTIDASKRFSWDDESYLQAVITTRQFDTFNRAGKDSRQQYFDGDERNQDPNLNNQVNMALGDPDRQDWQLSLNGEKSLDNGKFYGFANVNHRNSDAGGFFRRALDNRTLRSRYGDGFLPRLEATIEDISVTLGWSDNSGQNSSLDISNTFGKNRYQYRVNNSVNISMGDASPSTFDAGELAFWQNTLNLDWSNSLPELNAKFSLGAEYRYENYQIVSGEPASYIHGGSVVLDGPNAGSPTQAGAQVFPGFTPDNARDVSHNGIAGYLDYEQQVWDDLLVQGAIRFEHHQQFDSTFDYKIAGRWQLNDMWRLRAAASTGFRAPTLAQKNFTSTALGFIDGQLLDVGTFAVDAPVSQALGATELKPEQSRHLSIGASFQAGADLLIELDLFDIDIKDRIELSGNISQNPQRFSPEVIDILNTYQVANARFFTNAIDTQTKGADFALRYGHKFDNGQNLRISLKYHYNQTELAGDIKTPGPLGNNPDVIFNRTEANRLTARQPNNNLTLSTLYQTGDFDITVKALRFGSVHLVFFDDRPQTDHNLSAKWLMDFDITYRPSSQWRLALGAHNLFDTYPDHNRTYDGNPFYGKDQIFQYSDGSPFGFNGGTWYFRAAFQF